MTSLYWRIVAWLLMAANTAPLIGRKEAFYQIKAKLLEAHAMDDGTELQHVKKDCWSCDGTGRFGKMSCWKCNDGVYLERWYTLQSWIWHGHHFHTPGQQFDEHPIDDLTQQPAHIHYEGKIEKTRHWAYHEAGLWLFLLFDRPTFKRAFLGSCRCQIWHWPNWLPLTALQRLCFWVRVDKCGSRDLQRLIERERSRVQHRLHGPPEGVEYDDIPF